MKEKSRIANRISFILALMVVLALFGHMLQYVYAYFTKKTITVYEVIQGSISSNKEFNAFALRDETVFFSPLNGSIIYLAPNASRVSVRSKLYAIDESGSIVNNISKDGLKNQNISPDAISDLMCEVSSYSGSQDLSKFDGIYRFKSDFDASLSQIYLAAAMDSMSAQIEEATNTGTFHTYKPTAPGIIVYNVDGMEDITLDTFNSSMLLGSDNGTYSLKNQHQVSEGQPIYKMINSDKWQLVMEIDNALADEIRDDSYVEIRFLGDDACTWTECTTFDRDGHTYLLLTLDDGVERYANQRNIPVKVLNTGVTGLKLPNSAIVSKEFYTIPKEYFYSSDEYGGLAVMVKSNQTDSIDMVSPTIYFETEGYYYIDPLELSGDNKLVKGFSNSATSLYDVGSEKDSLLGVYNVNKGYAVFKQIEIIYQNEEYSIIKTGTSYGIAMYDHIALQGDIISENELINK